MDLASQPALLDAVGNHEIRLAENCGLELVLLPGIRAHCGDVGPLSDLLGAQQRIVGRGGGDDEVAGGGDLVADQGGLDREPVAFHGLAVGVELLLTRPPDHDIAAIDDRQQRLDLHLALDSGAEDPDALDSARRKVLGDNRAGGSRSHVGEVALVLKTSIRPSAAGRPSVTLL